MIMPTFAQVHSCEQDANEHRKSLQISTGTEDHDDKLHIYLLIGQSNMAGRAKVPEEMAGVIDDAFCSMTGTSGFRKESAEPLFHHP